jgi:transcriptional regulator with XRE-family HTH domain
MHDGWSKARVISVLAALEDAGIGRRELSKIAGVDHSSIGRWARGDVQPGYQPVRRLAAGIWRRHPGLARELVEASGWPWQEPRLEPEPLVDPELAAALRKHVPGDAEDIIAELERRRSAGPRGDQEAS